jgi:hypothetical protein
MDVRTGSPDPADLATTQLLIHIYPLAYRAATAAICPMVDQPLRELLTLTILFHHATSLRHRNVVRRESKFKILIQFARLGGFKSEGFFQNFLENVLLCTFTSISWVIFM